LASAFVLVCIALARRPTPQALLVGVTILAIAFFILPTRVHERYLFPFIGLGAILAAASIRWRIAYVLLSLTTFLNMYVVLTTIYRDNPHISDWLGIGGASHSPARVSLIARTAAAVAVSHGSERPSLAKVGPSAWFGAKLAGRPVRAAGLRALRVEPPGRFDRLDLWLLVVLIAATRGVRMFRLSEPYQMHFDEVY